MVTTDGAFAVAWISGMIVFLQTHTNTQCIRESCAAMQNMHQTHHASDTPCIRHTSADIHTMLQTSFGTDKHTLQRLEL